MEESGREEDNGRVMEEFGRDGVNSRVMEEFGTYIIETFLCCTG